MDTIFKEDLKIYKATLWKIVLKRMKMELSMDWIQLSHNRFLNSSMKRFTQFKDKNLQLKLLIFSLKRFTIKFYLTVLIKVSITLDLTS